MLSLRCSDNGNTWVTYLFSDVVCFSVDHLKILLISIFTIILNIGLSTLMILLAIQRRIDFSCAYSQLGVSTDIIFHLIRTCLLIFFVIVPQVIRLYIIL